MGLPNYNPSNADSLSGVIAEVLKNFSLSLENCMPAVVLSYDRANNTVEVQPAINTILTDGKEQARDVLRLPVHILGGNGIVITAPLKKGDTGWIIAGDRDISLFKQSLKVSNPNTYRTHKLGFGFFIPDKIKGVSVANEDENALTIQTLDGNTKISIQSGKVKIVSSDTIEASCSDLTINGASVSINGESTITGNVLIDGNLTVTGTIIHG